MDETSFEAHGKGGTVELQGSATEWSLGYVKCAPRQKKARTRESCNLGTTFLADPCTYGSGEKFAEEFSSSSPPPPSCWRELDL